MKKAALPSILFVVILVAVAVIAEAQQPAGKTPRIGFLINSRASDPVVTRNFDALRQGLRDLGYINGKNINFEYR